MKVIIDGHKHHYEMECLTKLFFIAEKVTFTYDETVTDENYIYTGVSEGAENAVLTVKLNLNGKETSRINTVNKTDSFLLDTERTLGRMVYDVLSEGTGIELPWGILTGIRPVKLFHRELQKGFSEQEVRKHFAENLLLSDKKIDLALRTQKIEAEILKLSDRDSFSLYISIPFCPSRCSYCSFVSHSIDKTYKLIPEYIEKLCEELKYTAKIAKDVGLKLSTVYFGGGTPTSIDADKLKALTDTIEKYFDLSSMLEYTIEAGRPDTITEEKLRVIHNAGVTRISINPQTFIDDVLKEIGRKHSAEDIIKAYDLARKIGFNNINMDLIAGLSGDSFEGFKYSMDRAISLAPENITVHTLSLKRAADLSDGNKAFLTRIDMVSNMVDYSQKALYDSNYNPYYLYRQKSTIDNLENVGYSKAGFEGKYNVFIMDECQTILAVGAGAVTKLKSPDTSDLKRVFNYKFPYEYLDRFDEVINRKGQVKTFYENYRL